jgi:hypothetical protein
MKNLFLLISLFAVQFSIIAQEINGFEINSGKLEWVKVFESNLTQTQILDLLKVNGKISEIENNDFRISGNFSTIEPDYKGLGIGEMSAPIYLARNWVQGKLIIDFKEGRYKVILRDILLTQKYTDAISQLGEVSTLDSFAVSKMEFKSGFLKNPSKILDHTFTKEFSFEINEGEDW